MSHYVINPFTKRLDGTGGGGASFRNTELTGIVEWGGAGNYYSIGGAGSDELTILRPGSGLIEGVTVTWAAGQATPPLLQGATTFVYIDTAGTIGVATTRTEVLYQENIILFEALNDNSGTPTIIVVREDHPWNFPYATSNWAHDAVGSIIENVNNGANITLNGTKGIQINGTDDLSDHGLEVEIPDSGAAAVNFSFMYTDGGGKWIRDSIANTFTSEYNNAGTVTALGGNKYGVFRLYVSKDDLNSSTPTFYAVLDTQQYNNLTQANTAISNGTPAAASAELSALEFAQLGFVVKEQSSDTIVNVEILKETLRSQISTATSNQASLITTDVANFDGWLSAADTTVQAALETLDALGENNSRFFAWLGATQTNVTGDGTTVIVANNTEIYDDNNDYNTGTFTFTAPTTGIFVLTYGIYFSGLLVGHNTVVVQIVTSNRTYLVKKESGALIKAADSTYITQSAIQVDMDVGDTAHIQCLVSGSTKTVDIITTGSATDQRTFLSGARLI